MVQISKLSTRTRVTEANGTATNILDVYSKTILPEDAIMGELKTNNDILTTSVNKDMGIAKTEEFDAKRDLAYQNLYHFIFGMTKLPDNSEAITLWRILERYGLGIAKEAFAEETSKINSLLEELQANTAELTAIAGATQYTQSSTMLKQRFKIITALT
ncbi:MAG: DUF6261 family protein [Mangrovibacterium sp.]